MLKTLKKNSIFKFFSSLKLAVILLVALAIILAVATFYESIYDTKTAQYLVYRSPLFAVFLGVLGLNLTCSALQRYPWKRVHLGFVVTHLGIITILIGSLVTMFWGVDGSLALEEGEKGSKVTIDQPVLYFGKDMQKIKEIPAEYRWNRPSPGKTQYRYPLDDSGKIFAVIDNYYHHAQAETVYTPDQEGMPALELRLYNPNVDQKIWLTPADGKVPLGLAQLEFFRLVDDEAVAKFRKPAELTGRGSLQILLQGEPLVVELDRVGDAPYPLEGSGATLKLLRYLPHAAVEDGELISRTPEPINPAVEIELKTPEGTQNWLLFSLLPELNTRTSSSGAEFESRLLYNRKEKADERTLEIGLAPDQTLYYRLDGNRCGVFTDLDPIATGWMNLKAEKVSYLPRAKREKQLHEVFPKKGKEDKAPGPAIRLTLEGAGEQKPIWLERGDIRRLPDTAGEDLIIGYGYQTIPLDFEVELKEFRIGYDPGTTTAATYESDVEIDGVKHTIAMNEPYERGGCKVFQASYSESTDGSMVSVFAVADDPGIDLKYLGSILLVLGIIIQFYFKPKKARLKTAAPGEETSNV